MGQRTFIHNITKGFYNEEIGDAVEKSEKGDVIKFSRAGNALVIDLLTLETSDADSFKEFQFVKDEFLNRFKEFHEEEFV